MMVRSKVVVQKVVSPDGKSVAVAKSVVVTSDDGEATTQQSVTVESSTSNSYSYSSSSATSSS